jgi:regulator of protease activity HflC (stomatin/prohibitin superfamily)
MALTRRRKPQGLGPRGSPRHPRTRGPAGPSVLRRPGLDDSGESPRRRGDPPAWALSGMRSRGIRRAATFVLALVGLVLVVAVSGARVANQDVGYVGVVRNGGPFDTRDIRQVLMPGQRLTWTGWFSSSPHEYPAAGVNRTYTVTSDPARGNRPGVDAITVPTKDGVQVGLEATVFMRFVGERDLDVLKRFEASFGARRFPTPDGQQLHPWEGDEGFAAWLDTFFRPVLDYNLRREFGRFQCAALVASCSLVSRGAGSRQVPEANVQAIAERVSRALEQDLAKTFGQPYLWDIRLRIAQVGLPKEVQTAVDEAQAKFVAVNGARAELRQARFQALRNRLLGRSYNDSPGLTTIETMKALPNGTTVILNTSGRVPSIIAGR